MTIQVAAECPVRLSILPPHFSSTPSQSSAGTIPRNSIPPPPPPSATNSFPSFPAACSLPAQPARHSRAPSRPRARNRVRQSRETRRARRLEFSPSSPHQNPPGKNIPCARRVFVFVIVSCRLSGRTSTTGSALPSKMPTVVSRPTIFSSTKTSESNFNASASAFCQSSARSTNCRPTLEPCRTGFTTSGNCKSFGSGVFAELTTSKFRRRHAGLDALLLRQNLVERDAARFGIAARVKHAEFFQAAAAPCRPRRKFRATARDRRPPCPAAKSSPAFWDPVRTPCDRATATPSPRPRPNAATLRARRSGRRASPQYLILRFTFAEEIY